MGSIYRSGGGGGGGSIYRSGGGGGGGSLPVGTKAAGGGGGKPKGGILGTIEHVVTQTPVDLYHAAINAPAGFVQELGHEVKHLPDIVSHPGSSAALTAQDAKSFLAATGDTLKHPLRHPGDTLLTLLPVGEGLARVGEAAMVARAGASAADVAKTLVNRGVPAPRVLQHEGLTVDVPTAKSALGRAGQTVHDTLTAKHEGVNARRVGKELAKNRQVTEAVARGPAAALIAKGRKLKPEQQTALRTVAEGVPTDQRIAFHKGYAHRGDAKDQARHNAKVTVLEKSKQYVDESGPKPKISASHPELQKLYVQTVKVAKGREQVLEQIGKMTPEAAQGRIHAPAQLVVHGQENLVVAPSGQKSVRVPGTESIYKLQRDFAQAQTVLRGEQGKLKTMEAHLAKPPKDGAPRARPKLQARVAKQRAVVDEWKQNVADAQRALETKGPRLAPAATPGQIRVPYTAERALKGIGSVRSVGTAKTVGYPRTPGSLTHQFTGGLLKSGNFRDDTTRLVGESNLEAQHLASLLRLRDQLKRAVKGEPKNPKYDIPMRLDNLKSGVLKPEERALLAKLEEGGKLTDAEKQQAGSLVETVRSRIFPQPAKMTEEDRAAFQKLHDQGRIGYIDSRLLRGMGQSAPRLEAILGRRTTKGVDLVNNAARSTIFYGKGPGFVIPNALGNAALNIVQQGFLAAPNFVRAVKAEKTLGPDLTARIDELMGEGISRTLAGEHGVGTRALRATATAFSRVTDRLFRRSAFLYEARRAGYASKPDVSRLVLNDAHRPDLVKVTRQANDEVLNFQDLTPREKEIATRLVFVYPYLKAATKYGGTIVREHPVKSGVLGQLGSQGYAQNRKDLAPFPSYFEGAFKVGGSGETPLIVNPAGVNVLQTPAQVGAAIAALATGHTNMVSQPSGFSSPAASVIGDLLGGKGIRKAATNLVTGLPQVLLAQRLAEAASGSGARRVYPPTTGTALGQFLLGSIGPRYSSTPARASAAAKEKSGR